MNAPFFTNTANTTGPSLAPGGAGWAPPCDRNKKENIIKIDYQDFIDRLDLLDVYQYNYKARPKEQICYGVMAQDWHTAFPTDCKEKDVLSIETHEMVGVLLSS